ncbi:hypothetical protein PSYCG_09895 [Psychrobacter sp. G]|uniref:hypothetical protein n=1 Tax=Psychrobacter sp. G TaxID=571800 RepID=UPI000354BFF1|nr:hypothetical protein [Psychrobacter sp. G]AGP49470.1 hypothetical protein PSYCG_09895 [Psychrobacter sp. G]
MAAFHHGISAQEKTQGILPMRNANVSVIGLVVTSTNADDDMYPLDTPVLLTGITQDNIDKAGTTGTLRDCLQSIRDIYNPTVVILRVTEPLDVDTLDVLLTCQSRFGLMPKRLGAPEIDTPDVVLKLVSIAKRRRAMVYASPRNVDGTLITDKALITALRDTYGDRELCIIDGEWGLPGKPEGGGSSGFDDIPPNFTELPYNPLVKINNEKNGANNATAYFAVEINGVIYNADKSQDLLLGSILFDGQVSFFEPEPGVIGIGAVVAENKKVRLIPSEAQKEFSNMFLQGDGLINSNGTISFNIFSND